MDDIKEAGRQLHLAAKEGNINEISKFISSFGYSSFVNYVDEDLSQTILHVAASEGHVQLVDWLLKCEQPLAIDARDKNGWTPLHCACHGFHVEIIKKLLQSNADPRLLTQNLSTPLHYLAKHNLFDPSVSSISSLQRSQRRFGDHRLSNSRNSSLSSGSNSPLDISPSSSLSSSSPPLKVNASASISSLRSSGGINLTPKKQQTTQPSPPDALIPKAKSCDSISSLALTRLEEFSKELNGEFSKEFSDQPQEKEEEDSSKLLLRTSWNDWQMRRDEVGRRSVRNGINILDNEGSMGAAEELIDLFLLRGAEINARNSTGETVLHKACFYGWKDNLVLFMRKGADTFIVNKRGESCIDYAERSGHSHVIDFLITEWPLILRLPDEILAHIFGYLSSECLLILGATCSKLRRIINDDRLWERKCRQIGVKERKATGVTWKAFYIHWNFAFGRYSYVHPWKKTSNDIPHDHLFPVLFVGDTGVGKTSAIYRFVENTFQEHTQHNNNIDFRVASLCMADTTIKLQIWDTERRERSRSLAGVTRFRGAKSIGIFFDVTNLVSFQHVQQWIKEVNRYGRSDVIKVVIGTKADLEDLRTVPFATALEFCEKEGIHYVEISSKENRNVDLAFALITHHLIEKFVKPSDNSVDGDSNRDCIIM